MDDSNTKPIDLVRVRAERSIASEPRPMPVVMPPEAETLVAALYRTEDIAVAPDGRRVVIPGFFSDVLLLADLDVAGERGNHRLEVSSASIVQCEQLRFPHGAGFVDDRTVLVANRGAELLAIDVPPRGAGPTAVFRTGRVVVGEHDRVPVRAPSSLAIRTADGLGEVLVCNNGSHEVTRYLLDLDDDLRVVDREVLIGEGLHTPDGVAFSRSGRWLAVSNHTTHEVFLYSYEPAAAIPARRVGTLRGPNYPHGVRFADDDRAVVLNDAGLPFLYVYAAPDGDWSGVRDPARTVRVMDDETFNAGRYNPQEGGPKGLVVLDEQRAVVVTSTYQHLACLSLDDLLDGSSTHSTGSTDAPAGRASSNGSDPVLADLVRRSLRRVQDAEEALVAEQRRSAALAQDLTDLEHRSAALDAERARELETVAGAVRAEIEAVRVELDTMVERIASANAELVDARSGREAAEARLAALEQSTCWRITRPVRAVLDRLRVTGS